MFAEVIIPLALPKNYTWSIPERLLGMVGKGCRVEVSLRNKRYAGVVKSLHRDKPEAFDPRPIEGVLDPKPIVGDALLDLWTWMASYYMCGEGEVMAAALPAHFKLSSESILLFNEAYGDDFSGLDDKEFLVAEGLLMRRELRMNEVQDILDASYVYPVVKSLIEKGVCIVWEALQETYKERREKFVMLHPDYHDEEKLGKLMNEWKKSPKQLDLLLAYLHYLKTEGEVKQSDLLRKSGATAAQLKGLADKKVLLIEQRQVDRLAYLPKEIKANFVLSPAQEKALHEVREKLAEKPVCLLHGVTSSGKTQIYMKLMEACLNEGRQVLYLLPEIALTGQVIRRLQQHFGGFIGVYHSKFNQNERVEIWNKVRDGALRIILGVRSSLFLPFHELGLIVVDEEHDSSFKQQEPAPRYHARDAAIYYAGLHGARVVLGSATPSLESYHNALQGKYGLVTLSERYGGVRLPPIEIIDTRKIEREDRGKVLLSPPLKEAIEQTLSRDRQVILFQNRRGYAPYQVCARCGWTPQCRNCDVTLTYHKAAHQWRCHYCGTSYPVLHTCPACGSHDFVQRSFGTEKIEETLLETFPGTRVARMDLDSVRGKTAHDQLIRQFEDQRVDILVGTQMVVKGLDFAHVDLVGILDADSMLHFADFRVHERAFQLMEQVSGRAGRTTNEGTVMIQVMNPGHPVLQWVERHDYRAFYDFEVQNRAQFAYPPFTRLIRVTFRHRLEDRVMQGAEQFTAMLRGAFGAYMTGPAAPVVHRVRNQYLMELLIKLPRRENLLGPCKQAIRDVEARLHQDPRFKGVTVVPDVDPV